MYDWNVYATISITGDLLISDTHLNFELWQNIGWRVSL